MVLCFFLNQTDFEDADSANRSERDCASTVYGTRFLFVMFAREGTGVPTYITRFGVRWCCIVAAAPAAFVTAEYRKMLPDRYFPNSEYVWAVIVQRVFGMACTQKYAHMQTNRRTVRNCPRKYLKTRLLL